MCCSFIKTNAVIAVVFCKSNKGIIFIEKSNHLLDHAGATASLIIFLTAHSAGFYSHISSLSYWGWIQLKLIAVENLDHTGLLGFRLQSSFRSLALFPLSIIFWLLNLSDWQTQQLSRSFTCAPTRAQHAGTDMTIWSMPLIFCCFLQFNNQLHKTCSISGH